MVIVSRTLFQELAKKEGLEQIPARQEGEVSKIGFLDKEGEEVALIQLTNIENKFITYMMKSKVVFNGNRATRY